MFGLQILKQGQHLLLVPDILLGMGFKKYLFLHLIHGMYQFIPLYGLQEVVDSAHFKGFDCKTVVSCRENYLKVNLFQFAKHIKAVHFWHGNIEKHQVGRAFTNGLKAAEAIPAGFCNFHLGAIFPQQYFQGFETVLLVVDDECFHMLRVFRVIKGIFSMTRVPAAVPSG